MGLDNPADMEAFWCIYLGCCGNGLGKIGNPIGKGEGKCLCIEQSGECRIGAVMGESGLCAQNNRCICFQNGMQIPPSKPFVEICGFRVFGAAKPAGAPKHPGQIFGGGFGSESVEGLQAELKEAIEAEDFIRANELKNRRDQLLREEAANGVPGAIQMA
mmetsp:Transcript_46106/g.72167  ORF Transcript_46106/g.72167 Transcript_46106/m.72167 type:complete len:160 (+) Transcript_46106:39-518(+)